MLRKILPLFLLMLFFSPTVFAGEVVDFYHINPLQSYFSIYKWAYVDSHNDKPYEKFLAKFKDVHGIFSIWGAYKEDLMIVSSVASDSLSSGDDALDIALKSPDFFDAGNYPEIYLNLFQVPEKLLKVGEKEAIAVVTIKGITKEYDLGHFSFITVEQGKKTHSRVINCGDVFESLKIDLRDFGMDINDLKKHHINPKSIGLKNEIFISFRFETLESIDLSHMDFSLERF